MEYTTKNPQWLKWIAPEKFNDKELFRIVVFFVFHSPCPDLSAMGKPLSEYNWHKPWASPYKLRDQLKEASSNPNLLFSADNLDKMSQALEKADLKDNFPNDFSTERICFYNDKHTQFISVFWHIRNALAHGRINIVDVKGECIFVLEDVNTRKKNPSASNEMAISARMIIKKSTLLQWIDIIEGGEKEYVSKMEPAKKQGKSKSGKAV